MTPSVCRHLSIRDLTAALAMAPPALSIYLLTIDYQNSAAITFRRLTAFAMQKRRETAGLRGCVAARVRGREAAMPRGQEAASTYAREGEGLRGYGAMRLLRRCEAARPRGLVEAVRP